VSRAAWRREARKSGGGRLWRVARRGGVGVGVGEGPEVGGAARGVVGVGVGEVGDEAVGEEVGGPPGSALGLGPDEVPGG
jgi:hypothetical protein